MKIRLLAILICVLALVGASRSSGDGPAQDQNAALSKIAPWVLEHTADGQQAEFLIIMADQADLSGAASLGTKKEKGRYVYRALYKKAQETQGQVLDWLKSRGVEHRSYYLINMVWVKATRDAALELAARSDVKAVEGNPVIRNKIETPESELTTSAPATVGPGINHTRAPEVWQMGYTGQGVVVAGADTGYRWDHTAIRGKYRGMDGMNTDHNFNWHDSIHSGGGSCGPNSTVPCDDNGHGTHTMGTILGDDGGANQVGMAPGAKWIGCRNMDQGNGTPTTYIECMEFFLAPYPIGGTPAQGDPDLAPDITSNSWGCPPSEGCSPLSLQAAVEAQRAAGIMMVVAAGNSGSACSSVVDPPALYDAVYTVGAISHTTGNIASFSSRGPVLIDGSNRLKPDITAPGVGIRSSTFNTTVSYGSLSGTSMATPHVAGALALLFSAQPALRDDLIMSETVLNTAAVDVASTQCDVGGGVPNNVYGFGRMDVKAAVDAAPPCTRNISESSKSFSASAGGGTVDITAVAGCGWTAKSNDSFITVMNGSGAGDGTFSYSVTQNTTTNPRTGTIMVGDKTFTVYQGAAFIDVPSNHLFYNEIGKLSARGITVGCGGGNFCPEGVVTREEMAAFIIRALGVFNPPAPGMQRYGDVPPSNPFYAFIEEMAVRQITVGCGGGNYCPSGAVTREQMAAFIIRALGVFNPPVPGMQRYGDVPPSNLFYAFIEEMAVRGITLGCGGGNYCPLGFVTRGQMAAFLVRAFNL
jgi:serine protease AprX